MDRLAVISLLAELEPAEREQLAKQCAWRTFRKDQTVVESQSDDRDVYFLVSGSVRIVNYSLSGRPVAYASIGAGAYFGELAAIDGGPRSASVVADEECQLGCIVARCLYRTDAIASADLSGGDAAVGQHCAVV